MNARVARKALLLGAVAAAVASGFPAGAHAQEPVEDPIFEALYPPELIMQHRRAIGLTDEQRDAISRMIQELQGRVVSLQWEMLDELQALSEVLRAPRVDLDRALDQMDSVLDREKEVKQAHLELLVRIKNALTPQQHAQLDRLRGGDG